MEDQRPGGRGRAETGDGDRDLFLRVWDRVMPEERAGCPIVVERNQGRKQPMETEKQVELVPMSAEGPAQTASRADRAADDFPTGDDVSCLGTDGRDERERLQEMVARELTAWRGYQNLARRGGQAGRPLAALAAGCLRRAKRLSAALFLLSGVRFWPAEQVSAPLPRSYFTALREHFFAEQNRGQVYRAAAEECWDDCLQLLYLELSDDCFAHACRIRALLEEL